MNISRPNNRWTAETASHAVGAWNETADVDLTGVYYTCPAHAHNNVRTS